MTAAVSPVRLRFGSDEEPGLPDAVVTFSVFDLHREKRLLGCSFGSAQVRRDIPRLVGLAESGNLDLSALVTKTMPLTEVMGGNDSTARSNAGKANPLATSIRAAAGRVAMNVGRARPSILPLFTCAT